MKDKTYEIATFTAPKKLLKRVREKATQQLGRRKFSKHVTRVLEKDLETDKQEGGK